MQIMSLVGNPNVTLVMYSSEEDRAEVEGRVFNREKHFAKEKRDFNAHLARHGFELDQMRDRLNDQGAEGAKVFPLETFQETQGQVSVSERAKKFKLPFA